MREPVLEQVARRRRAFAQVAPQLRHPALWAMPSVTGPVSLRIGRVLAAVPTPVARGVRTTRLRVSGRTGEPSVGLVVYEPPERLRPSAAVLWMHGGGTVMGRPRLSHERASRLARDLRAVVVSVDYRLAPEQPVPAALHDCAAALAWLAGAGAAPLGVDPERLAVGGESAGGLLAASLCLLNRDQGLADIRCQVLVYPMLDDRTVLRDDHGPRGRFMWTPEANRFAWKAYLGHSPGEAEPRPYAVPGRCDDLGGLPPAWIGVGDLDLFHDEDVDYARRLDEAGVPCRLHVVAGMYHAADVLRPGADAAEEFRAGMAAVLRERIAAEMGP